MARFLNPFNEDVDDIEEDLVEAIIAIYSYNERAYETDKEDVIISRVKDSEAL